MSDELNQGVFEMNIKGLTPKEAAEAKAKINQDISVGQTVIVLCHVITDIINAITVQEPELTEWEVGDWFVEAGLSDDEIETIHCVKDVGYSIIIDRLNRNWDFSECRKVQVKL